MKNISISKSIWKCLREVKDSQNLKHLGQAVKFLLDYHESESSSEEKTNVYKYEKPRQNSIEEIHSHVDKIRPLQESAVDMAPDESLDHTDDTIEKKKFISCPVCWNIVPLVVKLDQDGNPLKKHEDGIEYKMVDGVLQRRFSGPDDNYLPFQIQTGGKVIVEDSMAISTLRRLNKKMFDDFTDVLKAVTFKFTGGWW